MFILKTEHHFDSAHFLHNYEGKCSNIHGHRWNVVIEVQSEALVAGGQLDGMVVDFGDLKRDVKEMVDYFDHALIIQSGTMREETLLCLKEDGFTIIEVDFRPTAENFSLFFYNSMKDKGYNVKRSTVYETPTNSATYEESRGN
ncbi:6-carboxytetrahydropterin synthase QueD [Serpentinicella alkaliphila]|uniref:6-carboxy-5,6,7,8-tetrahydropterin synthase n=1 Tax=Serpentinicella alkaliphila TaxID=1734049 RepID=A0A4R2UAA5_9FIRM|nr:6-carboxytetrahydropterin synthase QueD [Serpentinicella alkaliphila]QUH24532.1 6-carboxytetrahydropterin synthase QueD [Serpentinicella alkaliphila]TCQ04623.1 preQ(0) biosynthesis protein QueD [Serpentinicella alkaliphila]